jgi:hypothetical protein
MHGAAHDGLIYINITISDLEIETARGISTDPGFVVDCCALATEVRQRDEVPFLAFLTLGEIILFHEIHLPT